VVLDPFFGSGTTGAVAKKLGRHFIGIERDEGYVNVAPERIVEVEPAPDPALILLEPRRKPQIPFGALLEVGLLLPGQRLFFAKNESITTKIL
jgi:modification methylase